MYRNLMYYPLGLASSALTAIKTSQYKKWNSRHLATSLALVTLAKTYPHIKMSQIIQRLDANKPKGIKKVIIYTLRFIQLGLIFLPTILLLPLAIFDSTRQIWKNCFVWSISKAGVVWIKVFQHMSHRGDVIGQDLAQSFEVLRSFSPQHSYEETVQVFRRVYGETPQVFFDHIDPQPIASGSISQVYSATFRGQKVAVKVRHPNIQKNIQKDISIVFGVGKFLALFSLFFQIPIDKTSFRQKLIQQLDFRQQKNNLQKFNRLFTNPQVSFPEPYEQSKQQVLIMSFVPGQTMTQFQKNCSTQIRNYVARIGASAFFQMVFQHNFVHLDCHGGNIMVKINKQYTVWTQLRDYYRIVKSYFWNKAVQLALHTPYLKQLAKDHNKQQIKLRLQLMRERATINVALIDVGMVLQLQPSKRQYFLSVLTQVIQANPKKCAQMIYGISKYRGQQLKPNQYPAYIKDLQQMFQIVQGKDLKDIKGLDMLKGMLRVIRKHRMKLDGQFATLLSNMLALEGIAKKLDPQINIMRCAVPYMPYKNDILPR